MFRYTLSVVLLALASCSPVPKFPIGVLHEDGFRHVTYDYAVGLLGDSERLMGNDWRLDNYVASTTDSGLGDPKVTEEYMSRIAFDHDGDGVADTRMAIPTFDLLFKHRRNDGVIFLSTFPISQYDSDRDLSVMLRDYVESASHAGRITHNYRQRTSRTSAQMASRILTTRAVSVDGFPAHEVIFEVANVQQLELTPDARWERGHVVLVRTEFVFSHIQSNLQLGVPYGRSLDAQHFYPVLMVIGYSNHPDEFDTHQSDFRTLVRRIRIGGTLDHETLRGHARDCGVEQLDVLIDWDLVMHTSLEHSSDEWDCVSDHVLDARFPPAEWVRTLSLRRESLRAADRATTAGNPALLDAFPPASPLPSAGGENPVASPAATPTTTDAHSSTPTGS